MKKHNYFTSRGGRGLLFIPCALLASVAHLSAAELLNENFDTDDGGFTQEATGETPIDATYNAADGTWSFEGDDAGPSTNLLTSPAIAVASTAGLQVTLVHRYSIESQWDGVGLQFSVDDGPFQNVPASAFSQNGYDFSGLLGNHPLKGLSGFNGESADFNTPAFVTSIANIGGVEAGSTVRVRILGGFDELTRGTGIPNWEVDSILVETLPDGDGDGMPDTYEDANGLDKALDDSALDADSDNSTNLAEYLAGTDPQDDDSDDDTLLDGSETNTGTFVSATDTGTNPLNADTDGDGLNDNIESNSGVFGSGDDTGTNPNLADTDSDGVNDGFELANGTDPFDDQSFPGPAPTLTWDASADSDGDSLWPTLEVPQITGIAWNFGSPKAIVVGASNFSAVTAWYNSPSAIMESFNDAPLNAAPFSQATNQPVSFELVFRPVDLVDNHLLFETGGNGDGLGIVINGDTLLFRAQDANSDAQRIILSHTFSAGEEADFQHVVGTLQVGAAGTNEAVLYVNGVEVDRVAATGDLLDWAGSDNSGLGVLTGSTPTGQTGFAPFTGDIAIMRFYALQVLDASEVQTLYDGLSIAPDSDSDDLRDSWERANFLDLDEVATGDPDADGLNNLGEFNAGTNPNLADSDGDGTDDNDEVTGAVNPYTSGVLGALPGDPTLPTVADSDGDGLDDTTETSNANGSVTDPNNQDTDGDLVKDNIEIDRGFDPTDANSTPPVAVITLLDDLIGGDLTDPENDGVEGETIPGPPQTAGSNFNWVSITANAEEYFQGFGAATEGSFDLFDNKTGGGEAKLCCGGAPVDVTVEFEEPVSLTHFTLTSSNDTPARDPLDFEIQGSNDGVNFEAIYTRSDDESIWGATRNLTARIDLPTPSVAYSFIRYAVTRTGGANHALSEIEYFGEANSAPPAITDIVFDPETDQVTLTFDSRAGKSYSVFASLDLIDFELEITDSVISNGDSTSTSFTSPLPNEGKVFYRVVENE